MKKICFNLFIFICCIATAQKDSVLADANSSFSNGLYVKFSDWRHSTPIPADSIRCKNNDTSSSVYVKLKNNNYITYSRNGKVEKVHVNSVWGYVENRKLYVYFEQKFEPVNYTGAICVFYAYAYHQKPTFSFNNSHNFMAKTNKAFQPFLFSFYNGSIAYGSPELLSKFIKPDAALYQEYKSLDKEKQAELVKQYAVKYNNLHPVYILK